MYYLFVLIATSYRHSMEIAVLQDYRLTVALLRFSFTAISSAILSRSLGLVMFAVKLSRASCMGVIEVCE